MSPKKRANGHGDRSPEVADRRRAPHEPPGRATAAAIPPRPLVRIGGEELLADTAQSGGMQRLEAISGKRVGAQHIWMGRTHVAPGARSADHHHGPSETGIHVVSGHPVFVFLRDGEEVRVGTEPGDFVWVPPFTPHREENPDPENEAVVVIARSTQEAIVVNLPGLRS
jgi:uncharacterized RmlC-like cupin family protein